MLQWSHVLSNVETEGVHDSGARLAALQWSHVLSNVETWRRDADARQSGNASMEPRPLERGNVIPSPSKNSLSVSFNGATSSRTWKQRAYLTLYSQHLQAKNREARFVIHILMDTPTEEARSAALSDCFSIILSLRAVAGIREHMERSQIP